MSGGGRTFRRKTSRFWDIWVMLPKIEESKNDKNLVILGNEKENIKGIEYTVLRGKLSYRPACCPKCGIVNENYDIIKNGSQTVKILLMWPQKVRLY